MNARTQLDPDFWDRQAEAYSRRKVPDEAAYQATLERVRAHLTPEARVLEFGCGTGSTALTLSPCAASIVATDLSPGMIEIAKSKAKLQAVDNVEFLATTLEDTSLEAASFDRVMCFNLLHLVDDVPATLRRVVQLLKPGGLFITKTPCLRDDNPLYRVVIPAMRAFGKAPYVNFFSKSEFQTQFKAAGFTQIEQGRYPAKSQNLFLVGQKAEQ